MSFISQLGEAVSRTSNCQNSVAYQISLLLPSIPFAFFRPGLPPSQPDTKCSSVKGWGWSDKSQISAPIVSTWETGQAICSKGLDQELPWDYHPQRKETEWPQDGTRARREQNLAELRISRLGGKGDLRFVGREERGKLHKVSWTVAPLPWPWKVLACVLPCWTSPRLTHWFSYSFSDMLRSSY